MNIAIVDDSKEDQDYLCSLINSWSSEHPLQQISISTFQNGEQFLEANSDNSFDLIFLDVYMGTLNGIETAQRIRVHDPHCRIVFLTSSVEHTWESFSVHPFDYLVKPCSPERLNFVISEAFRTLTAEEKFLTLSLGRQKLFLTYGEIFYLIADGHYVRVFSECLTDTKCYRSSFSGLWAELHTDSRFLLCNRGIILNMDYVEKMEKDYFVMKNGESLPIRQSNRSEIVNTFLTFQYSQAKQTLERFPR